MSIDSIHRSPDTGRSHAGVTIRIPALSRKLAECDLRAGCLTVIQCEDLRVMRLAYILDFVELIVFLAFH
jgi:hypothetical protein